MRCMDTPSVPIPRHNGRRPKYANLYERLVANTTLDERTHCWVWKAATDRFGYPRVSIRLEEGARKLYAHRLMLEMKEGYLFPFDEAGHLCCNPSCINPEHLEIQTTAFNMAQRRGYASNPKGKRMIPVLFPFEAILPADDPLMQLLAMGDFDIPLDAGIPVTAGEECPF
jgi:hypothetical protein